MRYHPSIRWDNQESQYRTGGCTSLATGMIYFGYRSIPIYRFGLPLFYIFNIYIYIHTHKISILEHIFIFIFICLVVKVHIIIIYYEHLNLNLNL